MNSVYLSQRWPLTRKFKFLELQINWHMVGNQSNYCLISRTWVVPCCVYNLKLTSDVLFFQTTAQLLCSNSSGKISMNIFLLLFRIPNYTHVWFFIIASFNTRQIQSTLHLWMWMASAGGWKFIQMEMVLFAVITYQYF